MSEQSSTPSIEELRKKADELGIEYDGRSGMKSLSEKIEAKEKENSLQNPEQIQGVKPNDTLTSDADPAKNVTETASVLGSADLSSFVSNGENVKMSEAEIRAEKAEAELEAMKAKIAAMEEAAKSSAAATVAAPSTKEDIDLSEDFSLNPALKSKQEQAIRRKLHKEQMALIRCKIYNLDPSKADLQGEIISVQNKFLGTVRKFIPFGEATENGYHIPRVLFDNLKARKFQQVKTRNKNGQIEVDTRMVPEYNLIVMEPLTEDELKELAVTQQAAERVGI